MPNTTLGITYPSSTDHNRQWEHLQELATDVDTLIGRKGWIAESTRTSASGTITTTETIVQSVSFTAVAGVKYKVTAEQSVQSSANGESAVVRLRWASGGTVTNSGTQIDSKIAPCNTATLGFLATLRGTFTPNVNGTVTVGVGIVRNTGTGNITSFGSSNQINTITIEGV
ncbi:hypothetical protein ACFWC6_33140 [Micromonospora chalcea]